MRDRVVLVLLLLLAWSLLARSEFVSPLFLASPGEVFQALGHGLKSGTLALDLGGTLSRALVGLVIGGSLGVGLGVAVGSWSRLYHATIPLFDFARSVPVTALLPLFLLFFGLGSTAKIVAIAWASGLVMLINTLLGVRSVSATRLMVAATLRARVHQRLPLVVLPDALPQVFIGIRTAVSYGVVVAIVSEMLVSTDRGIGAAIYNASMMYRTPDVYLGIVLAGGLGYLLNLATAKIDSSVVHWRGQ